ncbi:MAG: XRE family transcriptional regulator, partial [Coprobacillus cateniformis]
TLVNLNTIANFFVSQALISQILLIIVFMSLTNNMAVVGNLNIDLASTPQLIGPFVFSYIIAGIYAFIHYKSHKTDEYCL